MLETASVFDVMAVDDFDRRVASRQALALARTRLDNTLGRFLRGAVTKEEWEARFAACEDEFALHVAEACDEVGHDHPEHVAKVLAEDYLRHRRWQPREAQDIKEVDPSLQKNDPDGGSSSVLDDLEEEKPKKTGADDGNTDLGGPEPVMDKHLWTPESPGDPQVDDGQWPTVRKDITEVIGPPNNEHELKEHEGRGVEHQTLPNNSGDAGFDAGGPGPAPHTDTWSGSGDAASPVTDAALV